MTMERILVIDDDNDITVILKKFLTKHGYEVETAPSGSEGEKAAAKFNPDLIMSDYRLDDMDGATLLGKLKQQNPNTPVIIITGYSDLRTAVRVIRLGAFDYVTKPLIPDEILVTIKKALSHNGTGEPNNEEGANHSARAAKPRTEDNGYLFSDSIQSKNLEHQINLVAPTNYSVVIYGESGAGKEGVARMIHERSKRRGKPFVAMDCGAISKDLAGSELFGHEKGAFTGALLQKTGHFEVANGGTLFLDEVTNLSYEVQTLLLRVLQEKVLRRIGGTKEIDIDVRLIVASNEKLAEVIQSGKFREDLFYRLNEFSIEVPPLRKRKDDIVFFAQYFLEQTCSDLQKDISGFDNEVLQIFQNYPWYGNIRELKNVIKRAVLLSEGRQIDVKSLPFEILNHSRLEFGIAEAETNPTILRPESAKLTPPDIQNSDGDMKPKLKKAAMEAEYEIILTALSKSNFNKTKAAELLGVNRKTLYNKMKQMKLEDK